MKQLNKMLLNIIAGIMAFCIVFTAVQNTAFASSSQLKFEKTDVLNDLRTSAMGGKPFDIKDYPFDESKEFQVINFVEYCYSFRANMRNNYGLYLYVYNPKGLNIAAESSLNKVQMAVSYDESGDPDNYEKFSLKLCSKSEDSNYKNLFYKFKVVERKINGTTFAERVNSNERRYDVSGIELLTYGQNNASEYNVGGSYIFTGYAKGYGPDSKAENTLECEVKLLETVELSVKHTFYRTQSSSKGAGYQNQLDTVYFAVPNRFFNEYGTLQRIKAEWYEYKTKDIVVTSNSSFYNAAYPYIGVQTGAIDEFGMPSYNRDIGISLGQNAGDWGGGLNAAVWGWNLGRGFLHPACTALYYLFKVNDVSSYDPYADVVNIGGVDSNALYEYIKNYNKTYNSGTLPIKDGSISADLFAGDIDEYRKTDTQYGKIQQGYSYYDFDADVDLQKLSSWQEGSPSFWDNWVNFGLWNAMTGNIPEETSRTVSPIYTLKASDLNGTNAEVSDRLLINTNDVQSLRNYYNAAENEDKTVVLFRFSASDYYSAAVDVIELGKGFLGSNKHTKGQAYRAWESVFFDFDIIQLSFQKDGLYKVIPAVSSPIDIVNAITPPVNMPDGTEWWKILLGLLLLFILLIIIAPFLSVLISVLWWAVKLPFKLLGLLFIPFKRRKRRH